MQRKDRPHSQTPQIIMEIPINRRKATTLPEELVFSEILPKVPAKSLIRFKCVSKEWLDIITNSAALRKAHARHHTARKSTGISFITHALRPYDIGFHKLLMVTGDDRKRQTNINPQEVEEFDMSYLRSDVDIYYSFNAIKVFGSSNGLVLLARPLTWWNPVTKEFRVLPELPQPCNKERIQRECLFMDLGLDEESSDHKVVRVSDTLKSGGDNVSVRALNFQVFSKKADSWRELKTVSGFRTLGWDHPSVRINGAFYFLALQENPTTGRGKVVILSFMYRNLEVQNVIDAPNDNWPDIQPVRWKNSLALVLRTPDYRSMITLWGMVKNGDGGNEFCWSKLFAFHNHTYIRGVWSDQFLIVQISYNKLVLWDPQEDGGEDGRVELVKLPESWRFGAISDYIPTLISVFPDP